MKIKSIVILFGLLLSSRLTFAKCYVHADGPVLGNMVGFPHRLAEVPCNAVIDNLVNYGAAHSHSRSRALDSDQICGVRTKFIIEKIPAAKKSEILEDTRLAGAIAYRTCKDQGHNAIAAGYSNGVWQGYVFEN